MDDAPCGTHGCLLYETKQDLLDTLIPFFKTGLENRESCLWIVSEPLTKEEAWDALLQSVPDLDRHLFEQRIELVLEGASTDSRRLFHNKFAEALVKGHTGLRVTCHGCLEKRDPESDRDHENELNQAVAAQRLMVLCTYPIARSSAAEVLDAMHAHQVCASMRSGDWQILDTPELKDAKAEIKKLNVNIEQKVVERTRSLRAANEELKKEIDERQQVEDELRNKKEALQKIFDHIPVMISFVAAGCRMKLVNREWERTMGWTLEELQKHDVDILAECYPNPLDQERVLNCISTSNAEWSEFKTKVRDGRVIDTSWANVHLSDGTSIGFGQDITERKQWEHRLQATAEQLRALSASIQAAREEERTRVSRLVHDELGSAFTAWKWELEGLDLALSKPLNPPAVAALRANIAAMMKLADNTINTVRRIAWELRPSILDDLGLVEAIEWQTSQFESRSGIVCRRHDFLDDVRFNGEQSTAIFRIFQEALTNILRHAKATRVDINMTQEGAEFVLAISDNGGGIKGVEKSGLGILGMRERARLVGGTIQIHSVEGSGTTIALRIPMASQIGASA
jgi:PAS domain S-box-containing protein